MICNESKRTILVSGELGPLQMVSELVTWRCTSEDVGPKGMDCEIPHPLERGTKHSL